MITFPEELGGIAFDLDGTLYSRHQAFSRLMRRWMEETATATTLDEVVAADQNGDTPRLEFFGWLQEKLGSSESPEQLWQRFRHELPSAITPQLDTARELSELQAEFCLGLLTNGSSDFQRAKLQATALGGFLPRDGILVSAEIGAEKPDPRAFQALVGAIGLPAETILYVGDHWKNDIEGARAAGLPACWLAQGRPVPDHDDASIFVTETLADLFAALEDHRA